MEDRGIHTHKGWVNKQLEGGKLSYVADSQSMKVRMHCRILPS